MKGKLNKYYSQSVITAVELFSAGWCNLSCKYCYIPKTDFLKDIHSKIISKIDDGSFINDLKKMYGTKLESISHWGTEPTLTVTRFKSFYEKAIKEFPNLKEIKISSNFMTNPNNLVRFITEVLPKEKGLDVTIQVSLDGPPYITDKNRIGGSTESIVNNCLYVTEELNKSDPLHSIKMHLKPTAGSDDIFYLSQFSKAEEYYEFFDDFITRWLETNSNKRVSILTNCDPTLVLPGNYTSEDGKAFYDLLLNQLKLQKRKWKSIAPPESNYYGRFKQKVPFYREFFTKQKMFTCSAGDSCFALGDNNGAYHICHQSFYMDHEEYQDEAKKYGLDKQTMDGIEAGRVKLIKDNFITNANDDFKTAKLMYLTRSYNDFVEMKHSVCIAQTLELAEAGQINPVYKDIKLAEQLSYFSQVLDCPMNSLTITGSQQVPCSSILRVFGNGVFENIFSRVIKEL